MYADDATYQVDNKLRSQNQEKMDENLIKIQEYMNNNELSMNVGKTTTTEFMVSQKKGRTPGPPPKLTVRISNTETKEILDIGSCKILGARLQGNMSWAQHLEEWKESTATHYQTTDRITPTFRQESSTWVQEYHGCRTYTK